MRILLDHNVPTELRYEFPEEMRVETTSFRGWSGLRDGDLLYRADNEHDVLVTLDTSMPDQQAIGNFALGLVVLDVHPIHPEELKEYTTSLILAVHAAFESRTVVAVTEESVQFR